MNKWMNRWNGKWMNEYINWEKDEQLYEWMVFSANDVMKIWHFHEYHDEPRHNHDVINWKDPCWIEIWMDGSMNEWMNKWIYFNAKVWLFTCVIKNLVHLSSSFPLGLDKIISSMSPRSFSITTNTYNSKIIHLHKYSLLIGQSYY